LGGRWCEGRMRKKGRRILQNIYHIRNQTQKKYRKLFEFLSSLSSLSSFSLKNLFKEI
jgi:hypothetical protein